MEALITMQYVELKNQLDRELNTAAQSFVRIGYLLKVARDTDALAGSGYSDVSEFARAEYGLDRSQVSRFIRINERFGAGLALQQQYEGFGSSKLAEMLMLPDNVAAELPAEASKSEIRALAADLAEDEKTTTDLEIAMEDHSNDSIWLQAFREYFRLRPEEYVMLAERMAEGYPTIAFMDVIAPSGIALKTIRLSGIGKVTVSFRGNRPASILETRTGNREEKEVGALAEEISALFSRVKELSARGAWEVLYNEPFPAEAEENITEPEPVPEPVAPVQQQDDESQEAGEGKTEEEKPAKPEPVRRETAKPAKKAKVVDIVKPKPAPEPKKAEETTEAEVEAGEVPADIVEKDDEELKKAKQLAKTPMTAKQAILGEIRRLYRILGENIEENNWSRARGSLSTLREHIDRIEKEQEQEDESQMKFEDFPELMPGSGTDDEGQEEE